MRCQAPSTPGTVEYSVISSDTVWVSCISLPALSKWVRRKEERKEGIKADHESSLLTTLSLFGSVRFRLTAELGLTASREWVSPALLLNIWKPRLSEFSLLQSSLSTLILLEDRKRSRRSSLSVVSLLFSAPFYRRLSSSYS